MKQFLRVLFCWHIFKIIRTEYLNDVASNGGFLRAEYKECIKCKHKVIHVGSYKNKEGLGV